MGGRRVGWVGENGDLVVVMVFAYVTICVVGIFTGGAGVGA